MLENPATMSFAPSASATSFRNALLLACVALPWLNPFAMGPSTAVMPLLFTWMAVACLVLLVVDLPALSADMRPSGRVALGIVGTACLASLLWVPDVIDHALTLGLLAALAAIALMTRVGLHVAWRGNGLVEWVAIAWLVAAAVSSVLGVLQYLGLASDLSPWVNQPTPGDAFANLRQRNQFASLTSIGLVAGFALLVARAQRGPLTWHGLSLAGVLLNLLAAGVACSVSRTGALQWLLLGVLGAAWAWRAGCQQPRLPRALWLYALAAPCLAVLWSLLMPFLATQTVGHPGASMILRVAGQAQDYGVCGSRSVLWSNIVVLIAQRPWTGWGWGETDFAHFMTAYPGVRFCDLLDNAHNLPLQLAMDWGVPLALVLFTAAAGWAWRRQPWRQQDTWRSMAWGVLLVLGLHSLVEYPLWYGPFQMTLGLALGLVWSRPKMHDTQTSTQAMLPPAPATQAWTITVACALFLGCLYAAWDFNRVAQIYRAPAQRDAIYQDNPLGHAKASWLFRNQAEFAELTVQTVNPENAQQVFALASRLMHYSPEPRVVERLIDSAKLLGHDELAQTLAQRLKDAQHHAQR